MRCVCVGGNERERDIIENLLLSFIFYLLQYVFFEREMAEEVCMWE